MGRQTDRQTETQKFWIQEVINARKVDSFPLKFYDAAQFGLLLSRNA